MVITLISTLLCSGPIKKGVKANKVGKLISRNTQKHIIIPRVKATSAIRLTNNAFKADRVALILVNQKPISKKEQTPTPSHPRKRTSRLSELTSNNIKNVKSDK